MTVDQPPRPATCISGVADACCRFQRGLVGVLIAATVVLILLNVITRSLQLALYWVDELAVYCMIWAMMLGAATTVRKREAIAVQLIPDLLGDRGQCWLRLCSDLLVMIFSVVLLLCTWLWFDPPLLLAVDFEQDRFISASFNFVYRDPTATLGIAKFWFWLIMPVLACSLLLYSIANTLDSVGAIRQGAQA